MRKVIILVISLILVFSGNTNAEGISSETFKQRREAFMTNIAYDIEIIVAPEV